MQTVTRFPPSPTGYLHLGGARTALFNWLYAKSTGGEMVLRIEDTDRERSSREAVDEILDAMKWLGLTWNRGPFYQTERFDRYKEIIQQLVRRGDAYHCSCTKERIDKLRQGQREKGEKPRYDGYCRDKNLSPEPGLPAVIRFRNPTEGMVEFNDLIRGPVTFSNEELDDLIIARSDGTPTYNLTAVVDDVDMGVTHVLRGADHINNTPRQINILKALGASLPLFAHVPLILGEDGRRLSKRHGAMRVLEYRDMGVLPEALLNYLVRLGWSHGDQEIFTIDQMIELFDIKAVNKSPASFNLDKLLWVNQQYIAGFDQSLLVKEMSKRMNRRKIGLCDGPAMSDVVEVMRGRVQTLEEMADKIHYLYSDFDAYDKASVDKHVDESTSDLLGKIVPDLIGIKNWERHEIGGVIKKFAEKEKIGFARIAQPIRIAVSGSADTPSIDLTLHLVGRNRSIKRIREAIDFFSK